MAAGPFAYQPLAAMRRFAHLGPLLAFGDKMRTRIRDVRLARRMTLQEVAARCVPPTTPQTIGRLETGARTLSIAWLNRIAAALGVAATELVRAPGIPDIPVAATIGPDGAAAPRSRDRVVAPVPAEGLIAILVETGIGDYRAGDEVWLQRLTPDRFGEALNRDLLLPRPGDRLLFGRLIGRDSERLQIQPLGAGQRQIVVTGADWAAVATRLIRRL
jgi:transcriptional regulator with XRE-family HTH domain